MRKAILLTLFYALVFNLSFAQAYNPLDSLFTSHFYRIAKENKYKVYITKDLYVFKSSENFRLKRVVKTDSITEYPRNGNIIKIWLASVDSIQFNDSIRSQFKYTTYYFNFACEERLHNIWHLGESFYYTVVRMEYFDEKYYFVFKEGLKSELLYSF
jgi:hypothetical protein